MSFKNESDKRGILSQVLLNIEPISKAPKPIMDFPGAYDMNRDDLGHFEAAEKARDARKFYKAVDDKGNIYLMRNPWSCKRYDPEARRMILPKPKLEMTHQEAQTAAKASKAADAATTEEKDQW